MLEKSRMTVQIKEGSLSLEGRKEEGTFDYTRRQSQRPIKPGGGQS